MGYTEQEDKNSMWKGLEDNIRLTKLELQQKDYATARRRLEYELEYDYKIMPNSMLILIQSMIEKIDNGELNNELLITLENIERRWMPKENNERNVYVMV